MRKIYIKTQKPGFPTVKRLQQALSNKLGYLVLRSSKDIPKKTAFEYLFKGGLDKVRQFELFAANQVSCPLWTTRKEVAKEWPGEICARTLINSSQGKGLVICKAKDLPDAPLYTQYVKKKYEFRTQVFAGKPLRTTVKLKKADVERAITKVRNLSNGYIFANVPDSIDDDVVEQVEQLAVAACAALNYKFGAVDIIYNQKQGKAFVLEVNSAPAMEGTTLEVYSNAIVKELENANS